MMKVRKQFNSLAKAEQYQNRLYGMYEYVRLISSPRFSEAGEYVWEVK